MRLSKCCCMLIAVIAALSGCAKTVVDNPKDETEISDENILPNNYPLEKF